MTIPNHSPPRSPLPADDQRTGWLLRYEAWLRLLARTEIDSRFQGKFDASDAVQQTLLEAWKGWDNFRGSEEPQRLAWLRQILAHQLAHLARHYAGTQKRDVAREASLERSLCQSAQRLDAMLPAADPSPSQAAASNEQRLRLAQVLEQLPDDYRQVIVLRNLENLSHEEVARRMNRTAGAVRMLWVRALAALREAMLQRANHASPADSSR
jgi:RNA polymerase sigma-70 factor, ECF subfamily